MQRAEPNANRLRFAITRCTTAYALLGLYYIFIIIIITIVLFERPPRHVPKVCELFFVFVFPLYLSNNAPARRSAGRCCRRDNINDTGHRESDKSRLPNYRNVISFKYPNRAVLLTVIVL